MSESVSGVFDEYGFKFRGRRFQLVIRPTEDSSI